MMRILQLKTSASRGGAETLVLLMTEELTRRGNDVLTVVGEKGWLVDRLQAAGQRVLVFTVGSALGQLGLGRLSLTARKNRAEVILSHGARANVLGCVLSLLMRVPLVTVEHNVDGWRETSLVRNWIDRFIGLISRRRIAVSRAVEKMLLDLSILPVGKISTVPNGFKLHISSDPLTTRERVRERFGIVENAPVVVTVARFVEQKGHRVLIEAIPAILGKFPKTIFLFLGDGPLFDAIRQQVQVAGLGTHVLMPGAVDNVPEIFAGCDLFVLPSFWEGMPVALLEASGSGLPIIATAVAGVPEVIESGKTGLLVRPGDSAGLAEAIVSLLGDKEKRLSLARAGQEYVRQHHRIESMTDRYVEVLEAAIKSP